MSDGFEPPSRLALFPIRGCVMLPGEGLPLNVFEPRYLNMIDDVMAGDRYLGMVQPRLEGSPTHPELESVGCAGMIVSHKETEDGRYLIVLQGALRFQITKECSDRTPYRMAQVDYRPYANDLITDLNMSRKPDESFLALLRSYCERSGLQADIDQLRQAPLSMIVSKVTMAAPFSAQSKQALLEAPDMATRLYRLTALMEDTISQPLSNSPR